MTTTSTLNDAATAASEAMSATADSVGRAAERVRDELGSTERRARDFVEEYPLTAFFGAVLVGYLVGRIATRA